MGMQVTNCWVVALKTEAAVIREKYKMASAGQAGPYPVFKDVTESNWLTISGIGRVHAAAATMYLHHVSQAEPWTLWINVGIAGAKRGDYGSLFLVDKITERSTGHTFYPRPLISSPVGRSSLVTVDTPETNYRSEDLFDMEASAFFNIACRLSCQQLVIVFKIVSDGPNFDIRKLSSGKIYHLVSSNVDEISNIIFEMAPFMEKERKRLTVPIGYDSITQNWKFSQSRQHQLKHLLGRWQAFFPEKNPRSYLEGCPDAKTVVYKLTTKLDAHKIEWGKS